MTIQTVRGPAAASDAPPGAVIFAKSNGGYAAFNNPTAADINTTVKGMAYVQQADPAGTNKLCGFLVATGAITPPYTYTVKMKDCALGAPGTNPNNTSAGIFVFDGNVSGKALALRLENNNSPWNLNSATWNDWATFSGGQNVSVALKSGGPIYLRVIVHAANNIDCLFSEGGQTFSPQLNSQGINFLVNATYVGFGPVAFAGAVWSVYEWAHLVAGNRGSLL